jgi:hypothetical protein
VAFELFLRRLLVVAPDRWVLKGALALNFRLAIATRPTKDIDLGRDDDEQAAIADITAAQQLALDDYFTFAATRTDELEDTDEFSAVRFHVTAQLAGRTFEQFLVDIGFSERISWTPDTIHTSQSLSFAGIEPLALPAIPIPQHLAEKVHAYTRTYGQSRKPSTRPKDLVDILLIERSAKIKADELRHALQSTFAERAGNHYPPTFHRPQPPGPTPTNASPPPSRSRATSPPPSPAPPPSSTPCSPATPTDNGTHNAGNGCLPLSDRSAAVPSPHRSHISAPVRG